MEGSAQYRGCPDWAWEVLQVYKELAITPKSGALPFRRASLRVQSSHVMFGKLNHQTSDFETLAL